MNRVYREYPSLHELDFDPTGFSWENCHDSDQSVLSFFRKAGDQTVLVVCNFTPVVRENYAVGVDQGGTWRELLNSDSIMYGGSGVGNLGAVRAEPIPVHDRPFSLSMVLPPLAVVYFTPEGE